MATGSRTCATDAVAFLDAVGVERATVVGHSFGSFVARRVAVAHPERLSRLVLIDSGFSPANAVTRSVQESLRDLADPVPKGFARDFQASTAYLPPVAFFERIVAESVKLPSRLWREAFDGLLASDDTAELAGIRASTLLLWGDRDALFTLDDQHRLTRAIPRSRLRIYPETGHCPNWERPERGGSRSRRLHARRRGRRRDVICRRQGIGLAEALAIDLGSDGTGDRRGPAAVHRLAPALVPLFRREASWRPMPDAAHRDQPPRHAAPGDLLVVAGRLWDGTAAATRRGMALVVREGRVDRVAPAAELRDWAGARLDAGGATVMPGLMDLHVHLVSAWSTPTSRTRSGPR